MTKLKVDERLCAKQTTITVIENRGKYWIGSNWCNNPQKECPRKDLPTGIGYEKCIDVCQQRNHAEVDVCLKAGEEASGGVLYLLGHIYFCDDCKKMMMVYGIEKGVIGELPKNVEITNKNKLNIS